MGSKKKQLGIENVKIELLQKFLVNHKAEKEILDVFEELVQINTELKTAMESQSKLRILYLKAIRKIGSSEKISSKSLSSPDKSKEKKKSESEQLNNSAKRLESKAFVMKCKAKFLRAQAKSAKQRENTNTQSTSPASAQNPDGDNTSKTKDKPMSESPLENSNSPMDADTQKVPTENFLVETFTKKVQTWKEQGEYEPVEEFFTEEFPSFKDEGMAIRAALKDGKGDVRHMVKDILEKKGGEEVIYPFPSATLFHSKLGFMNTDTKVFPLPKGNYSGYRQSFDESHRFDISIKITDVTIKREVMFHPETNARCVAEQDLGPKQRL